MRVVKILCALELDPDVRPILAYREQDKKQYVGQVAKIWHLVDPETHHTFDCLLSIGSDDIGGFMFEELELIFVI